MQNKGKLVVWLTIRQIVETIICYSSSSRITTKISTVKTTTATATIIIIITITIIIIVTAAIASMVIAVM